MQKLINNLRHFQENLFWRRQEKFEQCVGSQKPQALLITCSDSRVLPETLLGADPGDLFVARNAGNLVPPPGGSGGEEATISYAVEALGVTDLVVCGHYHCGAVKALLDGHASPNGTPVGQWLMNAERTLAAMERDHPQLTGQERWDRAVEENVLVQADQLSKHPSVAAGLATGEIRIHAWVLRFESSEILSYDSERKQFVPILSASVSGNSVTDECRCGSSSVESSGVLDPSKSIDPSRPLGVLREFVSAIPSSLAVFAVALPLCVAIARACGVPTASGIITAIIGGVIVGLIGGGPLQVSGPTAGLIVLVAGAQSELGSSGLSAMVLLAGAIQLLGGWLRVGQWFRAVSPAVVLGMLAGIGLALIGQQFHVAVDDAPESSTIGNLVAIPAAIQDIFDGHPGHDGHTWAAVLGILTLAVLVFWRRIAPRGLRAVPSVLAAVLIASIAAYVADLPVRRVEFDGLAAALGGFDSSTLYEMLTTGAVWQGALAIAFLGSAETLLTATAADAMHRGPKTHFDRELAAQGVGNAICGILGALPMAGVIVRTAANIEAGAKTRWSTVLHGVWMLAFVLLLPGLLRLIPLAAMAATLVLTGFRLIQVKAIKKLYSENRGEARICMAVAATVVCVNLLFGVLLGIGLSFVKFIYGASRLRVRTFKNQTEDQITLTIEGAGTFIRLPKLAAALDSVPQGKRVRVDFEGLRYIDHSCFTMLVSWVEHYEATGGKLAIDWMKLKSRLDGKSVRLKCAT